MTSDGNRRGWLAGAVAGALMASFGTLTSFALAFLFPSRKRQSPQRIFLGFASTFSEGESRVFELPSGDRLVVTSADRAGQGAVPEFRGYSDRCPHLGCRVHHVASARHYFCPCHDGIFDEDGIATSGPPAQAGQRLTPYRVEVDGNSLYAVVASA